MQIFVFRERPLTWSSKGYVAAGNDNKIRPMKRGKLEIEFKNPKKIQGF